MDSAHRVIACPLTQARNLRAVETDSSLLGTLAGDGIATGIARDGHERRVDEHRSVRADAARFQEETEGEAGRDAKARELEVAAFARFEAVAPDFALLRADAKCEDPPRRRAKLLPRVGRARITIFHDDGEGREAAERIVDFE